MLEILWMIKIGVKAPEFCCALLKIIVLGGWDKSGKDLVMLGWPTAWYHCQSDWNWAIVSPLVEATIFVSESHWSMRGIWGGGQWRQFNEDNSMQKFWVWSSKSEKKEVISKSGWLEGKKGIKCEKLWSMPALVDMAGVAQNHFPPNFQSMVSHHLAATHWWEQCDSTPAVKPCSSWWLQNWGRQSEQHPATWNEMMGMGRARSKMVITLLSLVAGPVNSGTLTPTHS